MPLKGRCPEAASAIDIVDAAAIMTYDMFLLHVALSLFPIRIRLSSRRDFLYAAYARLRRLLLLCCVPLSRLSCESDDATRRRCRERCRGPLRGALCVCVCVVCTDTKHKTRWTGAHNGRRARQADLPQRPDRRDRFTQQTAARPAADASAASGTIFPRQLARVRLPHRSTHNANHPAPCAGLLCSLNSAQVISGLCVRPWT
jgi:hypothetical protein